MCYVVHIVQETRNDNGGDTLISGCTSIGHPILIYPIIRLIYHNQYKLKERKYIFLTLYHTETIVVLNYNYYLSCT